MKTVLAAILPLPLAAAPAAAATPEPWDAPFVLQVGAFRAAADTIVKFDADNGLPGATISFETNLGLSDGKTLPQIDFVWRWNPRHALEGSYVSLRRDAVSKLSDALRFGDVVFPLDGEVTSRFDSDVYRLAYRYSPMHENGNELSVLLGIHYTRVNASISSTLGARSSESSLDIPLPTLGVRGGWRIADRWRIAGMAQAMKLRVNESDGALYNFAAGIEWAFMPQAYAGLAYNYYKYEYESTKHDERIRFDYRFDGPMLYAAWAFR